MKTEFGQSPLQLSVPAPLLPAHSQGSHTAALHRHGMCPDLERGEAHRQIFPPTENKHVQEQAGSLACYQRSYG